MLAKHRGWRSLETGCLIAVVAATAVELYASMSILPPLPATQPEALRVPWAAAAFIRERQGLARTFAPNPPRQWPPVEITDIPPKLGMLTGLWVVADYENLFDARYARFLGYLTSSTPEPMATYLAQVNVRSVEPRQLPLLRLLGVGFILVRRDAQIAVPLPIVYKDDEYLVYELADPAPRAYVASQVRAVTDPESVLSGVLSDPGWLVNGGAFVEHTAAENLGTTGSVEVLRYTAQAVDLRVQLPHDGVVVVNDEYDPFWVATVDDEVAEVWRANYIFRGIRVPGGDHMVRLTYRPTLVYVGAAISLTSIALSLAAVVIEARRRRMRTGLGRIARES